MPITLPNLDDQSFDDLVAAAKRMIPGLAPSWTDHNASDPGITLVELFAYIAEMHLYRADRISNANKQAFVRLLRGNPGWSFTKTIDEEISDAVLNLRREERAVTANDFRRLTEEWIFDGEKPIARAHCLPGCNADSTPRNFESPAHVSVLIIPRDGRLVPGADLIKSLLDHLNPLCLLTTRLHVASPRYLKVRVRVLAQVFADQVEASLRAKIEQKLRRFFHPLEGGADGLGWPFGRAVYISELCAELDGIDGVDYVGTAGNDAMLSSLETDRNIIEEGRTIGIHLEPDELVELAPFPEQVAPGHSDSESWVEVHRYVAELPQE